MATALARYGGRPLVAAAVSAAGASYTFGMDKGFNVWDIRIPVPVVGAVLGVLGEYVGQGAAQATIRLMDGNGNMRSFAIWGSNVLASGAVWGIVPKLLNSDVDMEQSKSLFYTGVVASAITDYASGHLLGYSKDEMSGVIG
jgi:xanthosine utilization system XapX-like protein